MTTSSTPREIAPEETVKSRRPVSSAGMIVSVAMAMLLFFVGVPAFLLAVFYGSVSANTDELIAPWQSTVAAITAWFLLAPLPGLALGVIGLIRERTGKAFSITAIVISVLSILGVAACVMMATWIGG